MAKENLIQLDKKLFYPGQRIIDLGNGQFIPVGIGGNNLPSGGGGGEPVSSMSFYKCTSVDTAGKTWAGNKAVLTEGIYTFETTETTGLTYTEVTPSVGKIYTSDALAEVKSVYEGIKETVLVWIEPSLSNNEVKDLSQHSLTTIETSNVTVNDTGQMTFRNPSTPHGNLFYDFKLTPKPTDIFRIEIDFELTGNGYGYLCSFQSSGGDYIDDASVRLANAEINVFGLGWMPTGGIGKHSFMLTWNNGWSAVIDDGDVVALKPIYQLTDGLAQSVGFIGMQKARDGVLENCSISKFKLTKVGE